MAITSGSNSVYWTGLQDCDVGSWFYPGFGRACGRERASVTGSTAWACLSANGNAHRRDGAMWFNLPTSLKNCPRAGIVEALPDLNFKVAMDNAANMINNIPVKFPAGWGAASKRSIAGRPTYEVSVKDNIERRAPKCDNVQYADTYIWGEGDSVYVLKGSEETHNALANYHTASKPKQAFVDFAKSLGAKFYSDWRESEELREEFEKGQAKKRSTIEKRNVIEKRQDFPVIDAGLAPPGAGDTPRNVKDTL
ncbi:hypothetical protein BKA66DRAFT_478074, partial [Pyrenochaeta sp. MPI-SDFR-AT-0127]